MTRKMNDDLFILLKALDMMLEMLNSLHVVEGGCEHN
jgi:hypothetical protein